MTEFRDLTSEEIECFRRDGVLYLPNVLDADQVESLRRAVDHVMSSPTPLGADLTPQGKGGKFYGDYFVWRQNSDFAALAKNSSLPRVAAALMGSSKVNLVWDHMLVKEPNTPVESLWHHDQPYAWCDGRQNCSFWVSLDYVTAKSGAVEYIRGSHLWNRWFAPQSFNPTRDFSASEFEPMPDIESKRDEYDVVCFDTNPGDVVVQHLLTVHHAPGNGSDRRRRAVAVRYAGDDGTYAVRKVGPRLPEEISLKHGDPLDSDLFPVVYRTA